MSILINAFFVLIVVAVFIFIGWGLNTFIYRVFAQRDAKGRSIELTTTGKLQGANLPVDISLIARLGRNAEPVHKDDGITLRPTIGLRLISFALTLITVWYIYYSVDLVSEVDPKIVWVGGGLFLYMLAFTNLSWVKYNAESFSTMGYAFQTKSAAWRDVISIQDEGHYLYVLRTVDGQKLEIPKYMVGITDFLAYAQDQIALHRGAQTTA